MNEYQHLKIMSQIFLDTQELRKSVNNRTRSCPDAFPQQVEMLEKMEAENKKAMVKAFRAAASPGIIQWVKESKGIGEPLVARLLGEIGDPLIATPLHWEGTGKQAGSKSAEGVDESKLVGEGRILVEGEPYKRSLGQLRSYCGVGDPNRKRTKGMSAEDALKLGRPTAKMLLWNLAASCVKTGHGGKYRAMYDDARVKYEGKIHTAPCAQCHAKGTVPGEKGYFGDIPWKPGHQHAAALRLLMKEILKDLWRAAGGVHFFEPSFEDAIFEEEEGQDQTGSEPHVSCVLKPSSSSTSSEADHSPFVTQSTRVGLTKSVQHLVCEACGTSWTREPKRGRAPKVCPDCK